MSLSQQIDQFLQKRTRSERQLIYVTLAILIAFLAYEYLLPISKRFMNTEKRKRDQIRKKLEEDKNYLRIMTVKGDPEYYIKFYNRQIQEQKRRYQALVDKKRYLEERIQELSYLLYNKQKWAQFLNSLTHKAAEYKVQIDYIENTFLDVSENFGHVLEVEIGCKGAFKDLIAYLNDIEQSDLVVDVYSLQMEGAQPTNLTFKVSVWGINL
ncbi:MAG: hypothetical protein C6I00_01655 [Nitratiruptor sp.]|nr:hypothetical protein [Nitratiruptor sp.]NPA83304.1 hypothetical protein [Campylobacterota bacterium]